MSGSAKRGLGDRAAFLDRVRARLTEGIPENHIRPVEGYGEPVPPIAYAVDTSDLVATFTAAAQALTADVRPVDDLTELLGNVCEEQHVRRAVVSRDPECEGVADVLAGLGVQLLPLGDVAATATADLGVTGATWGIALTGSLIVDSTRAGARTASLLPPVHLALLPRDRILPDAGALLRSLPERLDGPLPSNLVFITGPSKSADIELQLTIGVHGPRALVIGLLPETSSPTPSP